MLSILIPVYNYDVRSFVNELHKQTSACGSSFEIRCYDDRSDAKYCNLNRELQQLSNTVYKELPANLGRSAIRNLMAREASFDLLLFLDCDSFPEYPNFIRRYLDALKPGALVYGGRSYDPQPPSDPRLFLRWFYGSAREVAPAEERKLQPYHSFQTNNFLIPKNVFLSIGLNEELKGYGHEDTLLGLELRLRKIPIIHIDDPLRHLGLESTDEFLDKTRQGIRNLAYLIRQGTDVEMIRLASVYNKLKRWRLCGLFSRWFHRNECRLMNNLHSSSPSLRYFDLYKLGLLIRELR